MGTIKEQNFQLKLALQDEDLKKPLHDDILFWVEEWAKIVVNMRPYLKLAVQRREHETVELDQESTKLIEKASERHSIEVTMKLENEKLLSRDVSTAWEGEPPSKLAYENGVWEPRLNIRDQNFNKRMVGFLDYVVEYRFTSHLHRTTKLIKRVVFDEPEKPVNDQNYRPSRKWHLEEIESRVEFTEETDIQKIYFEIKSEIRSVGDLMRQLTFYRSSDEIKEAQFKNGIAIIVVAPENEKATRVIREQGYEFVEYRRTKLKSIA